MKHYPLKSNILGGFRNADPAVLDPVNIISSCNSNCGCTQNSYTPVCGIDGIEYFSACHAGCSEESKNAEDTSVGVSAIY